MNDNTDNPKNQRNLSKINKHGLSRYVPKYISRAIRKRCGFGCVICGLGFYDIEHFDPDFSEATEHNPNGMTLLCSQCNQKRARGRLSSQTVAKANKNPRCLQQGFTSELLDFATNEIEVIFASNSVINCKHTISVNDQPILSINPPEDPGQGVRISGIFTDHIGRTTLTIDDNIWKATTENWDVECIGPRIIIRTESRSIALKLLMEPSLSRITVEKINMMFDRVHFRGDEKSLEFSFDGKAWSTLSNCTVKSSETGFSIETGLWAANDQIY